MNTPISRRQVLQGAAAATATWSIGWIWTGRAQAAPPKIELLETKVISHQAELYHGWPTVARRRNGQLLLVYSGGREGHICPFGRVEMMRSDDEGQTWGWPCVLMDTEIDDRDSGVLETAQGSILVTTFTSLAYEGILTKEERLAAEGKASWTPARLRRWQAAHRRLPAEQRDAMLGQWMLRSTDGGATWSAPYRVPVNSPHGPFQMRNGRLLYAGKELWHTKEQRIGVCESTDDGQTWTWLATIPTRPGDDHRQYHELHGVEAADGRLVVQIRNHNKANAAETLQTHSTDGGKTWAVPYEIGVWGLPSHLLRLKDDRLLMTYGHRRPPFGVQARLSEDHGQHWSEAILIAQDGAGGDLGYPSTVPLSDGSLLTVWYELMKDNPRAVLRQAKWKLV